MEILHGLTGQEHRVGPYRLDGYHAETKTAYSICYHIECLIKFIPFRVCDCLFNLIYSINCKCMGNICIPMQTGFHWPLGKHLCIDYLYTLGACPKTTFWSWCGEGFGSSKKFVRFLGTWYLACYQFVNWQQVRHLVPWNLKNFLYQ